MTWLAWSVIALAVLVTALNAWMTWQRLADASRMPAEREHSRGFSSRRRPKAGHEASGALEELDDRGYLFRRRLQEGCEAAVCRTPFGARIVAGKNRLEEPQYAWDYPSVAQARKALVEAKFRTEPNEGIVIGEPDGNFYPAAEPRDYFRRWRYTAEGQLQRL